MNLNEYFAMTDAARDRVAELRRSAPCGSAAARIVDQLQRMAEIAAWTSWGRAH